MSTTETKILSLEELAQSDRGTVMTKQLLGTDILLSMLGYLRAKDIHEPGNKIFVEIGAVIQKCVSQWQTAFGFSVLDIQIKGEQFFLNEIRIRPKVTNIRKLKTLIGVLRKMGVTGLTLPQGASPENVQAFLWFLATLDRGVTVNIIAERLRSLGLEGFEIKTLGLNLSQMSAGDSPADILFNELYQFVAERLTHSTSELDSKFRIDQILYELNNLTEEDYGLTFSKNINQLREMPLAQTAVLSAWVLHGWGRSLGLPPFVGVELAGCGLLHPLVALANPAAATTGETGSASRAPLVMSHLKRLAATWPHTELQMLSVLEFPIPFGQRGVYASGPTKCYLHIFSRMLRIAVIFVQMVGKDRRRPQNSPAQAMEKLLSDDLGCDRSLVRLFAVWMSLSPLGTVVKLSTGEIGVVCSAGGDLSAPYRPKIRLLKDREGQTLQSPQALDLAEINDKLGTYRHAVRETVSLESTGLKSEELSTLLSTISLATT